MSLSYNLGSNSKLTSDKLIEVFGNTPPSPTPQLGEGDLKWFEKNSNVTPKTTTLLASCGWWRGGGSMWGHPSTNHNSQHGRVVDKVVVLGVVPELLIV